MWLLVVVVLIVILYMIGKSKSGQNPKQRLTQSQAKGAMDEKRIEKQRAKQKKQYDAETERLYKQVEKDMEELKKCKVRNMGGLKKRDIRSICKDRLGLIREMKESDSDGTLIRKYMKAHYQFLSNYKSLAGYTTYQGSSAGYSSSTHSSAADSSPSASTGTDYYTSNSMNQADKSRKREIKQLEMDINDTRNQIYNLRRRGFAIDADEMEPKLRALEDDLFRAKYK